MTDFVVDEQEVVDRQRIDVLARQESPDWVPYRFDPTLYGLMEKAINGELNIYYSVIPFGIVMPFSRAAMESVRYNSLWRGIVSCAMQEWRSGIFRPLLVYQRGYLFVSSDDYITYAACSYGAPGFVPCWVLGHPNHSLITDVQGPVNPQEVLFGFSA